MVSIHLCNARKPSLLPPHLSSAFKPSSSSLLNQRKIAKHATFRAEFSHGACMLSSLVLPPATAPEDDPDVGGYGIDSTDTRVGKSRYAVYALVYLTPYISSNLSLSPEDSWLPIASIVFRIIHVQLEASIKNGDIPRFQFFNEAAKQISSFTKGKEYIDGHQGASKKGRERENKNLPFGEEQSINEIDGWRPPKRPIQDHEYLNEDGDEDERLKVGNSRSSANDDDDESVRI